MSMRIMGGDINFENPETGGKNTSQTSVEVPPSQPEVTVITGASRGIGRAIALKEAAVRPDNLIVVNSRTGGGDLDNVVNQINNLGGKAVAYPGDVTTEDFVKALFKEVKALGKLRRLVNNVGFSDNTLITRMSLANWHKVIDTNLTSTFLCSREAIKVMYGQKITLGWILNMTSVVAQAGNGGQASYVAAKAGVAGLTKALAIEAAQWHIIVNALAPGFVDTRMTTDMPQKLKDDLLNHTPLARFGEVNDIADVAVIMLSDAIRFMTGEIVSVNGGLNMG